MEELTEEDHEWLMKNERDAARIRERKLNFETIDEQKAELEEFRYKLDMFESRLRNSTFMDPEERNILHEQAKEAREQLQKLERKVNYIHRRSQKSLVVIFTIFTLFISLYIFLMVKTIWRSDNTSEQVDYD